MERKACPLLVGSETQQSATLPGYSCSSSYFSECLGDKCAAYHSQDGFCERFKSFVNVPDRKGEKDELQSFD